MWARRLQGKVCGQRTASGLPPCAGPQNSHNGLQTQGQLLHRVPGASPRQGCGEQAGIDSSCYGLFFSQLSAFLHAPYPCNRWEEGEREWSAQAFQNLGKATRLKDDAEDMGFLLAMATRPVCLVALENGGLILGSRGTRRAH